MLEAMALGCPVLAAAAFGVPELISDGDTGWLMQPRDHAALVAGLRRVLALDAASRAAVGNAGRAVVHARHRRDAWARRFLQTIDEVEAARAARSAPAGHL